MVTKTAVIKNDAGLHLKPAARFCEEALKYKATVTFTFGNKANAMLMGVAAALKSNPKALIESARTSACRSCRSPLR